MNNAESLTGALEDWFDCPLSDLPAELGQRVKQEFFPFKWDDTSAEGRRSVALQLDAQSDPATEQDQQFWQDFIERKEGLEKQISEWEHLPSPTASDLALKEGRLRELRLEWNQMQQQQRQGRGDLYQDETDNAKSDSTLPAGEQPLGQIARDVSGNPCSVFLVMENLTADEVSIAFVAGESGGVLLEVSARENTKRIALTELGLFDRRKGEMNKQGGILLGMSTNRYKPEGKEYQVAKQISRLRDALKYNLGIVDDPFEGCLPSTGWVPRFKITDRRDAADKRAKRDAEHLSSSYDQMIERGHQFASTDNIADLLDSEDGNQQVMAAETPDVDDLAKRQAKDSATTNKWMEESGEGWGEDIDPE